MLKYYETPSLFIFKVESVKNFMLSGKGDDADPKAGNWLYYYDDEI